MAFKFKSLIPRTLFARFFLILAVPALIVQLVASYTFYARHWSSISMHMSNALAGEIVLITKSHLHTSTEINNTVSHMANDYMKLSVEVSEAVPSPSFTQIDDSSFDQIIRTLNHELQVPFNLRYSDNEKEIITDVYLPTKTLHITSSSKRLTTPTTYIFILWVVGTGAIMLIISLLFLRTQIRSIRRLAEAAERFGKGMEVATFKPQGAIEVRRAADAFLKMKKRIRRMVSQRTELLAGVSHDLRTPLTRIKLQLAMLEDKHPDAVASLNQDVKDMEHMIQEYLDFAKGADEEQPSNINIHDFISKIVNRYQETGDAVALAACEPFTLPIRTNTLKRALTNIIDNAIRYGTKAEIAVNRTRHQLHITVDDNGPGIPKTERGNVFRPFYRLDAARNLDHGGVGLGLAITRDSIMSHGGQIRIEDSSLGGTRVVVTLPI